MELTSFGSLPSDSESEMLASPPISTKMEKKPEKVISPTSDKTELVNKQRIIGLNVGGRIFETTLQTLSSFGDNYFTRLFFGRIPSTIDRNGNYFIDRDGDCQEIASYHSGQYFQVLLEYLRTGDLVIPDNLRKESVMREAEFYNIPLLKPTKEVTLRNDGMYSMESNYFLFLDGIFESSYLLLDGTGITWTRDRFGWSKKELLVTGHFPHKQSEYFSFYGKPHTSSQISTCRRKNTQISQIPTPSNGNL